MAKYQDKEKVERYELGCMYKVKFFESTNAKVFRSESYLFGETAALTFAALDADARCITVSQSLTDSDARELTGKLVLVGSEPMCVERVDAAASRLYFRWMPASTVSGAWSTSTQIKPTGGGASDAAVYSTVVYGQNAFGGIELGMGGENVKIIINPPGSSGAADPLEQRGTIAWKVKGFCCAILQDAFIVRIEHGATA